MLARGVICRLAADAPKTSTHDLPRLSHLLQSRLLSRNVPSLPAFRALSRAYKAALSKHRRSYATTAGATKPTSRVKKDVKEAVAKKPVKKTAAKNTPKKAARKPVKSPAAKKSAAKKAKPKKKAAAKPKPSRKALTPEQKTKADIRDLKEKALRTPVTPVPLSAWTVFASEALVGQTGVGVATTKLKDAAAKYKALTPAEKEHYNHLANERTAAKRAEFDAWIRTHTPEQIRVANNARLNLKRRLAAGQPMTVKSQNLRRLDDDRQVKRPLSAYIRFAMERSISGDFKGIAAPQRVMLIAEEWKALSAGEKEKYNTEFRAEKRAYESSKQSTYGHT